MHLHRHIFLNETAKPHDKMALFFKYANALHCGFLQTYSGNEDCNEE